MFIGVVLVLCALGGLLPDEATVIKGKTGTSIVNDSIMVNDSINVDVRLQ